MVNATLGGLSLAPVEPSDEEGIRQWYELRSAVVAADWPDYPATLLGL